MSLSPRERRRLVTDEPHRVAPELLGRPLASPGRRLAAMAVDIVLAVILLMLALGLATAWSIDRDQPGFIGAIRASIGAGDDSTRALQDREWRLRLVRYVAARRPEALPDSVRAALAAMDPDAPPGAEPAALAGYLDLLAEAETFGIALDEIDRPLYDPAARRLAMDFSVVAGRWTRVLGAGFGMVAYFTILGWLTRGRSVGKALLGIRARRLDGRPMTPWSAWTRAGGYGASLGTAGLGFLQILWDPNRQAVHDRIAGTVVVREGRRRRRPSPVTESSEETAR